MSDVPKRMCKLKKGFAEKAMDGFRKAALPVAFVCGKCGRMASKKKYLCKPISLKEK